MPRPAGLYLLQIERSKRDCLKGSPQGRRGGACQPGAFGYHLHRKLDAMGVTNYVVQPRDWDERDKGVKNDWLDVPALCQRLDRFALGNRKVFSIVRVPSEDARDRAFARQLAVALWRLFTGQTTAEKLGLIYLPDAA